MQKKEIDNFEINDIELQKKKLRKRILIAAAAVLLVALACIVILVWPEKKTQSTDYTDALTDYKFFAVDNSNIFSDPEYTEEMRKIYYEYLVGENSESVVLDDESVKEFDASVNFMYDYIGYIMRGEVDNYNNCFSSAYYKKIFPKEFFTMQRLYDIKLINIGKRYENGMTVYIFKLDYKILKNDGTFRKDIDSSSSRRKTIYVTDRDGRLAIDGEEIQHFDDKVS